MCEQQQQRAPKRNLDPGSPRLPRDKVSIHPVNSGLVHGGKDPRQIGLEFCVLDDSDRMIGTEKACDLSGKRRFVITATLELHECHIYSLKRDRIWLQDLCCETRYGA
jgi:hypothetical protein